MYVLTWLNNGYEIHDKSLLWSNWEHLPSKDLKKKNKNENQQICMLQPTEWDKMFHTVKICFSYMQVSEGNIDNPKSKRMNCNVTSYMT